MNSINLKKLSYDTKRKIVLSAIAVISIIIVAISCTLAVFMIYDQALSTSKKAQLKKAEKYAQEASTTQKGGVVFLGDSIFEMYELKKFYSNDDYINRGISSNESADVLARLQTNVIDIAPRIVILHVGANDIGHNVSSDIYLTNMVEIIKKITTALPDCTLFVDSIYPTVKLNSLNSRNLTKHRNNTTIANLNHKLNNICSTFSTSNKVFFIANTYNFLLSDGALNKTCTIDGLHLSRSGYNIVTREFNKNIERVSFKAKQQ